MLGFGVGEAVEAVIAVGERDVEVEVEDKTEVEEDKGTTAEDEDEDVDVDEDEELGLELDIAVEDVSGDEDEVMVEASVRREAELEEEPGKEVDEDEEGCDDGLAVDELEEVTAVVEGFEVDIRLVGGLEGEEDVCKLDEVDTIEGRVVLLDECVVRVAGELVDVEVAADVRVVLDEGNRELELETGIAGDDTEPCSGDTIELDVSAVVVPRIEELVSGSLVVGNAVSDALDALKFGLAELDAAANSPTRETPWQSSEAPSPKTMKSWSLVPTQKTLSP